MQSFLARHAFDIVTIVIVLLSVLLVVSRLRQRLASRWPLFYYLLLTAYWKVFPYSIDTRFLVAGVACGILLRFVSLSGWILRIVQTVEFLVLGYVIVRGTGLALDLW